MKLQGGMLLLAILVCFSHQGEQEPPGGWQMLWVPLLDWQRMLGGQGEAAQTAPAGRRTRPPPSRVKNQR